jgi:hypothetical protein
VPGQRSPDKTFIGGFITKSLMAKIKAVAKSEGKTVTDLLTEMLEKKFGSKRKK